MSHPVITIPKKQETEPQAPVKQFTILLGDKEHALSVSLNTVIKLEERFGDIGKGLTEIRTITDLRFLLWAMLDDDEEELTEFELGSFLHLGNVTEAMRIFSEAFSSGMKLNRDPNSLAPYVPTSTEIMDKMLEVAEVGDGDIFLDPGCGDGRALVAAFKRGASLVIGCELDAGRYGLSLAALKDAGVPEGRYILHNGDCQKVDIPWDRVTVAFLYLLPDSNMILLPKLKTMKSGGCVVSHDFLIKDWVEPFFHDNVDRERPHRIYGYRVP